MTEYKIITKSLAEDLDVAINEAASDGWKIKTNPIITDQGILIIMYRV